LLVHVVPLMARCQGRLATYCADTSSYNHKRITSELL
jgi:hypothetical protein